MTTKNGSDLYIQKYNDEVQDINYLQSNVTIMFLGLFKGHIYIWLRSLVVGSFNPLLRDQ